MAEGGKDEGRERKRERERREEDVGELTPKKQRKSTVEKADACTYQAVGLTRLFLVQPEVAFVAFESVLLGRRAKEPSIARATVEPVLRTIDAIPASQAKLALGISRV